MTVWETKQFHVLENEFSYLVVKGENAGNYNFSACIFSPICFPSYATFTEHRSQCLSKRKKSLASAFSLFSNAGNKNFILFSQCFPPLQN